MIKTVFHVDSLQKPVAVLDEIFRSSGLSLIQAAFRHSFFLDPEKVRGKTPRFPEFARSSRTHYPGKKKGDAAEWKGRKIRLDDNSKAQAAWEWYSGRKLVRASGYGVRHVWGYPWNPDAYTAGWNLCYMPFWAGMLTEDQHPHPELQRAIQQAAYDLFFRSNPVCPPPKFVCDPGLDLKHLLGEQPILLLGKTAPIASAPPQDAVAAVSPDLKVLDIRSQANISWIALLKAVRLLQGKGENKFNSAKVEARSKYLVRKILRETGWDHVGLERFVEAKIAAWELGGRSRKGAV